MGRGGWDDPRARATRGLRKPSLDARSWDHPSHPFLSDSSLRPCLRKGASRRAGVGRVRNLAFLSILRFFWHQEHQLEIGCRIVEERSSGHSGRCEEIVYRFSGRCALQRRPPSCKVTKNFNSMSKTDCWCPNDPSCVPLFSPESFCEEKSRPVVHHYI